MWKKRQQINRGHISAFQQERGQLSQEISKRAKGLLKHHGKGKFRKEFKDRLGIFACICNKWLSNINSGWKERIKLLFGILARYKLATCSEQSPKLASEPNQKKKSCYWLGRSSKAFIWYEREEEPQREREKVTNGMENYHCKALLGI